MKKFISVILILATLCAVFAFPVSAASTVNLASTAKEALPNLSNISIRTYGLKRSGKIHCYTDSSLATPGSGWIDLETDECTILKVDNDGKALYIKYPLTNGRTTCRWFSSKEFLGINMAAEWPTVMVTKRMATYTRYNGGKNYGYADSGDKVYVLGFNSSYVCIVYPLSAGGYKLGYVKLNTFATSTKNISSSLTSQSYIHPMKNYHKNYTQWGVKPSYRNGNTRQYHAGVDYMSNTDPNIYAFTKGTVVSIGWQSANGNFILIEHVISGKTVYSFYGHLDAIYVSKGQSISAGTPIGEVGKTGSSGGNVEHLHFAITDYKWTTGGVYGYVKNFIGNKVTYEGKTYYNPYYVIENGKLP